jgi:type II secretory pathway predicted ATPase ExeA
MVRDRWNFTAPPFAGSLEPATFFCGAPQEEALARLEWLVDERQRFGLVVGGEGLGKSHLCAMAARRLAGCGAEVALLSLRGLTPGDWIELLLERLPLDAMSRAEPLRPWQKLENRLRENTLMERPTALVFDDLDRAPADAVDGVERLISAAESRYARVVVVATATPQGLVRLPDGIRQRAAVRIELGPWAEADVAGYLAAALRRVGGDEGLFTPEAGATLARFAGGAPRVVTQLAQLSLVAAAGDGLDKVDAATVERTWRELAPASGPTVQAADASVDDGDAAEGIADHDAPPANPRVRVVRRLWG